MAKKAVYEKEYNKQTVLSSPVWCRERAGHRIEEAN